jgi:hypothetical protein
MGEARQVFISVWLVFTVVAMIVANMPDSVLTAQLSRFTQPYLNFTGLTQSWNVFAPPPKISSHVDARVDYSDGTSSVFLVPAGRGLAEYTDYRWSKFEEYLRPDEGSWLWPAYARYVASRARSDGHDPVRVTLIRRWADTNLPGPGPERGPWQESTIYVMPVKGAR